MTVQYFFFLQEMINVDHLKHGPEQLLLQYNLLQRRMWAIWALTFKHTQELWLSNPAGLQYISRASDFNDTTADRPTSGSGLAVAPLTSVVPPL